MCGGKFSFSPVKPFERFMPDKAVTKFADSVMVVEILLNEFGLLTLLFSDVAILSPPIGARQGLGALAMTWGSGVVLRDKEAPKAAA